MIVFLNTMSCSDVACTLHVADKHVHCTGTLYVIIFLDNLAIFTCFLLLFNTNVNGTCTIIVYVQVMTCCIVL
jgi:hypothetical protein